MGSNLNKYFNINTFDKSSNFTCYYTFHSIMRFLGIFLEINSLVSKILTLPTLAEATNKEIKVMSLLVIINNNKPDTL